MTRDAKAFWTDLGRVEYERALSLQAGLMDKASAGGPGYILFLEHPPTITLGYSMRGDEGRSAITSSEEDLKREGIRVVQVDRGGKATYHGPGQLVCYLVLNLRELRLGVKRYVSRLQAAMVGALHDLGVEAGLDPSYPGVWVEGGKIAAVGIRVAGKVTCHGFALNVAPDLASFGHIVPCGIAHRPVTSLKAEGVKAPERNKLIRMLLERLEKELSVKAEHLEPADILTS